MSYARHCFITLFGAMLFYSATFLVFPTEVNVEAQTVRQLMNQAVPQWDNFFAEARNARGNGVFCRESDALEKFWNVDKGKQNKTENSNVSNSYYMTLRIVSCMLSPHKGHGGRGNERGAIIEYARIMLQRMAGFWDGIMAAACVLALTVLGVRVALGQINQFKPTFFVIVFKAAFLMWAISNIDELYLATVNTMNIFSGAVAQQISFTMCNQYDGMTLARTELFLLPWAKLDCALESIAAINAAPQNSAIGAMVSAFMSSYLGKAVASTFTAMTYAILATTEMALTITILANLALAMIFLIAPMAWITIFFKQDRDHLGGQYFRKWLQAFMAFALQPMLVMVFVMMLISAYERIICRESFSVVAAFNEAKRAANIRVNGSDNFGINWCQPQRVQEALNDLTLAPANKPLLLGTRGHQPSAEGTPQGDTEFFGIKKAIYDRILYETGFKLSGIPLPQLQEALVTQLERPLYALIAAFIILYILYAFLEQLPRFVNQLAQSAIQSGNLNEIRQNGMAPSGLNAADSALSQQVNRSTNPTGNRGTA